MKVHDVLHKGKVTLRILAIKDDHCFCINCNAGSMPAWMPANSLEDYTPDDAPMIDTNMTARQKQVAHERFTMIHSRAFAGNYFSTNMCNRKLRWMKECCSGFTITATAMRLSLYP